ncbi:DUF1674 domain-containing protein [Candidatus Paracaedibacter acanthamoebae]
MPETKVNAPENKNPESDQQSSEEATTENTSPTRFGDWEKNGRCIDF